MNLKKAAAMLLCSCFIGSVVAADRSKHVILITIDGMRAEMVTDSTMPSPNLKRMKRNGMFVERIKGITPTATYPSHTTIITGVKPAQHRIYYNSPFTDNRQEAVSYWYADSIKATTIWESASRNGLTVASLFWPVSVGAKAIRYNIPEYWSVKPVANQLEYIKPYCTPAGLLDELEREATGKLNHENFGAGSMNRDARTAAMANYLMNTYKPNLMTVHLITTDYAQHATGLKSDRVSAAVGGADHAVGLILENLERNKLLDSTTVIVCGDHGFVDYSQSIAPNIWLVQEGLLSEKPGGEWKACFHGAGAMMFLYLKDENDRATLKKIRKKLNSLPASTRTLFRIVEKDELAAVGCDPKVALALEPIKGVAVATARTGADVIQKSGGKHGYLSGIDPTTLVAFGCGIEKKEIKVMNQTDIAPFVMNLLGINFRE
ncbi:ectonucleotide pyrophosphatase/phosphodiesterase [uncultured Bacteroides sp.]|uniref:alkaline phosphatase family protein n=1 Tax=uncultured Bacteroides sp. TaxID=162156 RepID=UPI00280B3534|nr:ectonucleotide pyrophosphatase/phosphodiesterase [uncultured Bacteroides sp.]